MTDREALIEAMARAMFDKHQSRSNSPHPWEPVKYRKPWLEEAEAALSAIEAMGAVVVPVEATANMNAASYMLYMREKSRCDGWSGKKNGHLIYAAMIAASPYAKEPS